MAKRTNRKAWGLAVVLAVLLLGGIGHMALVASRATTTCQSAVMSFSYQGDRRSWSLWSPEHPWMEWGQRYGSQTKDGRRWLCRFRRWRLGPLTVDYHWD
jgi:hypothetical protein